MMFRLMFGENGFFGNEGPVDDLDVARLQAAQLGPRPAVVLLGAGEFVSHLLQAVRLRCPGSWSRIESLFCCLTSTRCASSSCFSRFSLSRASGVLRIGRVDRFLDFLIELAFQRVDPRLQLDHVRMAGRERRRVFSSYSALV